MNTKKLRYALVSAICAFMHFGASAQHMVDLRQDSLERSHRIISLDNGSRIYADSVKKMISEFYVDQFRHFQDPAAPYFMFMSRNSDLAMGIGGVVRMRGWYDWGGVSTNGFVPYMIPIHRNPAHTRHFGTTPSGSALFFRVIGRSRTFGSFQFYIQGEFTGGNNQRDFELKKAYALVNDFTIGYASSSFSDPSAIPPTIDAAGPNNKFTVTNVLVRWMHTNSHGFGAAFSVEDPSNQIDVDQVNTESVDQWLPDFASFLQYEWDHSQHIRLAGIVRTLPYRDMLAARNRNIVGWGLQLSSIFRPTNAMTCYFIANTGKGYASLGGDMACGNYDLVGDPNKPGHLYAPQALGWCVGLQYNYKPNVFSVVSFSQSRYLPREKVDGSQYKYGLYGTATLFWDVTPRMQLGMEYNLGKRVDFDGQGRWAQRVGALAQFSF